MATPNLRLRDKVIIVTGASSGIGRATALAMAAQGAKLVVCADLRAECSGIDGAKPTHEEICSLHGTSKAIFVPCDITIGSDAPAESLAGMEKTVAEAVRIGGRLDVLVNNAGFFDEGPLHETTEQQWTRVLTVNATGTFLGCKFAIRQFLTQAEDEYGQRGCIVNMASCAALKGLFRCSAYCASKAAITGLTREIAVEYGMLGIRANAICPGYTDTTMLKPWLDDEQLRQRFLGAIPSGKLAEPRDMTGAVLWLSCSGESMYVNGTTVAVDAGFHVK